MKYTAAITLLLLSSVLFGCKRDKVYPIYSTEYVIIIVIDGPRHPETWREPNHSFIPNQSMLRHEGVTFSDFQTMVEPIRFLDARQLQQVII
ncbi:MAG: hypothetical protein ACJA0U_000740 [Salibacteraceae bacterium]|jgi:hypothetical protein